MSHVSRFKALILLFGLIVPSAHAACGFNASGWLDMSEDITNWKAGVDSKLEAVRGEAAHLDFEDAYARLRVLNTRLQAL